MGGFGNILVPVMIGAPDMAKKKIKHIQYTIYNDNYL